VSIHKCAGCWLTWRQVRRVVFALHVCAQWKSVKDCQFFLFVSGPQPVAASHWGFSYFSDLSPPWVTRFFSDLWHRTAVPKVELWQFKSGDRHPLSPVIKMGIRHPRKKERKKEKNLPVVFPGVPHLAAWYLLFHRKYISFFSTCIYISFIGLRLTKTRPTLINRTRLRTRSIRRLLSSPNRNHFHSFLWRRR